MAPLTRIAGATVFLSPGRDVISPRSLVQIMTFESSINRLNYFKIVILIYTDTVLIIQAEMKLLGRADDGELNIAGSPGPRAARRGPAGRAGFSVMNWWHAGTRSSGSGRRGSDGAWAAFAGRSFTATPQSSSDRSPPQHLFIQQIPSCDLLQSTLSRSLSGDFSGITFTSICYFLFLGNIKQNYCFS